ncbi:hypothetical protein NO263_08805 [Gluconacetobacter entanii]|uniref:Uncharacterized protein n=1 Tax=Gluconacetobacter entanii TaxID=108528 RepID=A0ABT3K5N0_9PROT|nr:hypothetical protein [Gluconacetobacter entanii]MCW4590678.1 hypothetical protein [Gluconacetobacter entanii]MCW4592504.1 hypothetical protein [Gluconacetobacter entanii]NPC90598.1 hypothetical protein [Gluconacetobacter entanii]
MARCRIRPRFHRGTFRHASRTALSGALVLGLSAALPALVPAPVAHAASVGIPGLGDYARFGVTVTGNGAYGRCTVQVSFDAGRFASSAKELDSMGILDNVDTPLLRRRTNFYMRATAEEIAPVVVDHAFQRFGHREQCNFEFLSREGWSYGGDTGKPFMKFTITARTATQVDWYKASFDELHEVAGGFWEDAAFAGPAQPEEPGPAAYGRRY